MVFTDRCACSCGGGEGGYDGSEDNVGALGGVHGGVQPLGAVILHQREGLPVVGVQAGAERGFVVVAAADERFTSHLIRYKNQGYNSFGGFFQ